MKDYCNFLVYLILITILCFAFTSGFSQTDEPEIIPLDISSDGKLLLCTDSLYKGLVISDQETDEMTTVTDGLNAGYYAVFSPDGRYVCYKAFAARDGKRYQAPALYRIATGETVYLCEWTALAGTPAVAANGNIAYTAGNTLHVLDSDLNEFLNHDLGMHINLLSFSPQGDEISYCDDEGKIVILNIDGIVTRYDLFDEAPVCFRPEYSPDGTKILAASLDGNVIIADIVKTNTVNMGSGESAAWLDNERVAFVRKSVENFEVTGCKIIITGEKSGTRAMDTSFSGYIRAAISPKGIVISRPDSLTRAENMDGSLVIQDEIPIAEIKSSLKAKGTRGMEPRTIIDDGTRVYIEGVPVIHQVYDTPDTFNGNAACNATSALMALQYYNILPTNPITCSWPSSHTSDYGWYIANIYSYNGVTYNIWSNDPSSNPAYGGYGYCIQDTQWYGTPVRGSQHTSYWMSEYISNHGPTSFIDGSPTWAEALAEVDNEYPFSILNLITASGHYITCIGYFKSQHTLVFNDPYGDKNTAGYPSYDGEGVYYDWPGYNNGYQNLNYVTLYVHCQYTMQNQERFTNALENGGFEDDFNGWSAGSTTSYSILSGGTQHRGSKCCQLYRSSGYTTIWQNPGEINGEVWRTTCYAYYLPGTTAAAFGFKDQSGNDEASETIDETSWMYCSVDWTIADDIDTQIWGTSVANGMVIDDVRAGKASRMNWIEDWIYNGTHAANLSTDFFLAEGGESGIYPSPGDIDAGNTWTTFSRQDGFMDLNLALGSHSACVTYAHVYVNADIAKTGINLVVGADDGIKVFLNGTAVHTNDAAGTHDYFNPDEDVISGLNLDSGENRLLIKVRDAGSDYSFSARFCDENGDAVSGLTYSLYGVTPVDDWLLH